MTPKNDLLDWLNNAHAMELALAEVLKQHNRDAKDLPHVQTRLERHINETGEHANRLKHAIESIGGTVSGGKALLGEILGRFNAVTSVINPDAMVKNVLMDFAAEHFEIACYKSLIAAAEELGLFQVAEVCRQNLADEIAMAGWLEQQIPEITKYYLRSEARRMAA
jgi:ferritin-like metal-binding protein YciE